MGEGMAERRQRVERLHPDAVALPQQRVGGLALGGDRQAPQAAPDAGRRAAFDEDRALLVFDYQ